MKGQIYINGRFATKPIMGVTRYAKEVVEAMDGLAMERSLAPLKLICPAAPTMSMNLKHTEVVVATGLKGYAWEQVVLPLKAKGVLISLCNTGPVFKKNQIVCIHGMNTSIAPDAFSRSFRLAYGAIRDAVARNAKIVTTVSMFSRGQLHEWGVRPASRVVIAPCGCDHALRWEKSRSKFRTDDFPRPFIFALGVGAHKNFSLLSGIAEALDSEGIDIVIAGGQHATQRDETIDGPRNIRRVGFVSEDDLGFLFSNAAAFAFPSITEGFGIPPLEAMQFGCPVVASDAGSLPEVLADAAILLPPQASDAWASELIGLVRSRPNTDSLAKASARTQHFTWTRTAEVYLDLAQQMAR